VVTNNTVVTNTSPDHDETPEQVSASSLYLLVGVSGFDTFLMLFSPPQADCCTYKITYKITSEITYKITYKITPEIT